MKRTASIVLCFALMITSFGQTVFIAFAAGTPTITCKSKECYPGDKVTVAVNISNNPGITALELTTTYSSELGTPTITNGDIITDLTKGKQLVWVADDDVNTNGKLVSLTFSVAENVVPGDYSVGFTFRSAANYNEESIIFTVVPATVCVKARPVAVTGVSLDKTTATVKTGSTVTLTPTFAPETATNKNVTWATSDSTVATVENGIVSGVKEGTATVTVKTEDGNYESTCAITVECGHNKGYDVEAEASTCQKQGHGAYTVCDDCGRIISGSDERLPLSGHNYIKKVKAEYLVSAATCNKKAIYYKSCSVCGVKSTETFEYGEFNSSNHVGTYKANQKEATCYEEGYTGDTYCKGCGAKLSSGLTVSATGNHTWNNGVVTTVATCKSTGVKTYTCTVCKATKTEVIAKNSSNHTGGTELKNVVNASCGKAGYTGDTFCKGCGIKLSSGSTVNATGNHSWDSGTVTTIPTCKDNGVKTYTCTVCSSTKTETIAKTDAHTFGEWVVKTAATYDADGEKSRTCSVCGKEETKAIAKLVVAETAGDEETGIQMNFAEGTFTEKNVTLEVKPATKDTEVYKVVSNLKPDNNFEIYDISALSGETKVQPNGNVQISIPLSDKFDSENVSIYYVNDKGEMEKLQSYVKDGKIVFETNHFSYYVVVDEISEKEPDGLSGDINGDGKITAKDARAILRYSAKLDTFTNEQIAVADVNNDGKINAKDARKVLRVSAKLETM